MVGMASTVAKFLAVVGLLCVMRGAVADDIEHVQSWGDLTATGSTFDRIKSKIAIPFITREFTVSYPEVSSDPSAIYQKIPDKLQFVS